MKNKHNISMQRALRLRRELSRTNAEKNKGTKAFIAKLGRKAGRILSVLPRGRPKKQKHK